MGDQEKLPRDFWWCLSSQMSVNEVVVVPGMPPEGEDAEKRYDALRRRASGEGEGVTDFVSEPGAVTELPDRGRVRFMAGAELLSVRGLLGPLTRGSLE